jgi:competence protein ComEC
LAVVAAETAALAAYIVLSGNGAPVRRSAVAITLALLAPVFLRRNRGGDEARTPCRADPLSLWCFALTFECLSDPLELRSISLQLSYVATLGLILGTGPLLRILRAESRALLGPPVPQLGPANWWRVLSTRAHTLSCSALAASCAAVLATLPMCWNTFGEWSPLGVIATPLSVPFIAWLLVYGWAMIALPSVLPAVLFEAPARALVSLLEVVDDLPGTPAPLAQRPFWLLLGASAAVFAVLRGVGATHTRRVALARIAACAWCAVLLPWAPSPSELEVVALDVGHGTSIAVRVPGPVYWIYDCGSRDRKRAATEALAPLLASWEARAVHVVLSHTDRDHAGGLDWLVERYEIESWSGALSAPLGERLPHTVPRLDVERGALDLPSTRNRDLRLTLLRGCNVEGNEGSRSLRVEFGASSVLLSGDAQDDGLRALLELDGVQRPCQLLLAPHHGSESPWLGPLLDVARPEQVWISASSPAACEGELDRRRLNVRLTRRDGPLIWRPPREPPESAAPP